MTALLFASLGWHPMVGGLNKNERLALLVGAVIPAIPPTFVLGAYIMGSPVAKVVSKSRKNTAD